MEVLNTHFMLLLLITLSLATTPTYVKSRPLTNDLVRTTCKQTADPKICETALRADPRSSNADTTGLILIMIDTVRIQFSNTLREIQVMAKKTHDPAMRKAFKKCIEVYQFVVNSNVGEAVSAVRLGDPKFGEEAMTDSGNEAEACKYAFLEGKLPGLVAGRTSALHGVSNVAASMIKILE